MTQNEIQTLAREIALASVDAVTNHIANETANWPADLRAKIPDETQTDDATRLRAFRQMRPGVQAEIRARAQKEAYNAQRVEAAIERDAARARGEFPPAEFQM